MVQLAIPANSETNNQTIDFLPVPEGEYNVVILNTDTQPTKDNTGTRLVFTFQIVEGQYKGRQIVNGLNIENQSEKAVEIAYKELNTICQHCNKFGVTDTVILHGCYLRIRVVIDGDYNRIKGYTTYTQETAAPPVSTPTYSPPQGQHYTPPMQPVPPIGYNPNAAAAAPPVPYHPDPAPTVNYAPPGTPHPNAAPPMPSHTASQEPVPTQTPPVPRVDHTQQSGGYPGPTPAADTTPDWVKEQQRQAAAAATQTAKPNEPAPGALPPWATK